RGSRTGPATARKAAASRSRQGVGLDRLPVGFVAALRADRADGVDRLRGQADVPHYRHAALAEERNRIGHAAPAFELDRPAVGLLHHARAIGEGLFLRLLV